MKKIPKLYIDIVTSFLADIENVKNGREFEKAIGEFVLGVLTDLDNEKISPIEADDIFSYIDEKGIPSERAESDEASQVIQDLLFEGQLLHDLGTPHGADIEMMKRIAAKLIYE